MHHIPPKVIRFPVAELREPIKPQKTYRFSFWEAMIPKTEINTEPKKDSGMVNLGYAHSMPPTTAPSKIWDRRTRPPRSTGSPRKLHTSYEV